MIVHHSIHIDPIHNKLITIMRKSILLISLFVLRAGPIALFLPRKKNTQTKKKPSYDKKHLFFIVSFCAFSISHAGWGRWHKQFDDSMATRATIEKVIERSSAVQAGEEQT